MTSDYKIIIINSIFLIEKFGSHAKTISFYTLLLKIFGHLCYKDYCVETPENHKKCELIAPMAPYYYYKVHIKKSCFTI